MRKCCRKGRYRMKKTIFILMIAALVSVNSFTQELSAQARDLQGTWVLIGALNDTESYNEQAFKAERIEISYIFSGNTMTIKKNNETIGPVRFEPALGFLHLGNGEARLPYNLQGRILILHEAGNAYIYRKQ